MMRWCILALLVGCATPRRPPVVPAGRLDLEALTQKHFIEHAASPAEKQRLADLLDLHGKGEQAALLDGPEHPAAAERAWFAGDRATPFFTPEAAKAAVVTATAALPAHPRAVRTLWLAAHGAQLDPVFLASVAEQWARDWPESPEATLAVAMSPMPSMKVPARTPRFDLTWRVWQAGEGTGAVVEAFGFPRPADALYAAFDVIEIQAYEPLPNRARSGWRARVRFPGRPNLQDYRIIEALGGPRAAFTAAPDVTQARQQAGEVRLRISGLRELPNAGVQTVEVPDLGQCQARGVHGMHEQIWTLPARVVAVTLLEENRENLRALSACGLPPNAPKTE